MPWLLSTPLHVLMLSPDKTLEPQKNAGNAKQLAVGRTFLSAGAGHCQWCYHLSSRPFRGTPDWNSDIRRERGVR